MQRDTALDFTPSETAMWSTTTQAIALLADAHFAVFNEAERSGKATANRLRKALGKIYRAASYLRATAPVSSEAFDGQFFKTEVN